MVSFNVKASLLLLLVLCALSAPVFNAATTAAAKSIKKDDARKLIAALSILELNKDAVTIKEISPPGGAGSASVLASVKLAFRFAPEQRAGAWRVVEVRTGDRQWESFDLLERALGNENIAPVRAELDAFAAELDALAKNKRQAASKKDESRLASANESDQSDPPKELQRGVLSVKNPADALAPLGSSAVVELEVETAVDFVRDARGRWQVARVRFGGGTAGGGRGFDSFDAFARALDAEKLTRARADLETLAVALEAFRRSHGFYVVADSASALIDHLNPRHTSAFIRFDPWHRPYEYAGGRERYTLRSLGADGKANTPDDVIKKG